MPAATVPEQTTPGAQGAKSGAGGDDAHQQRLLAAAIAKLEV